MAKCMYMNGERNIHHTILIFPALYYIPRTMSIWVSNSLLYYPKGPQHGLQCQDIGSNLGTVPVPVWCKDQFPLRRRAKRQHPDEHMTWWTWAQKHRTSNPSSLYVVFRLSVLYKMNIKMKKSYTSPVPAAYLITGGRRHLRISFINHIQSNFSSFFPSSLIER